MSFLFFFSSLLSFSSSSLLLLSTMFWLSMRHSSKFTHFWKYSKLFLDIICAYAMESSAFFCRNES